MAFRDDVYADTVDRSSGRSPITEWLETQPDFDEIVEALNDPGLTARRILTKLQERGFPFTLSSLQNYRAARRWER